MTRQEARAAGDTHYTGKPCDVCRGTRRLVSNTNCAHYGDKQHLEERGALEAERARERVENMTPEQRGDANARWRAARRRQLGWYDEGGMATDEEMERFKGFKL